MRVTLAFICTACIFLGCAAADRSSPPASIEGCLYAQFFDQQSERGIVLRDPDSGRIHAVRTPTDRIVELGEPFTVVSFGNLVHAGKTAETYGIMANSIPQVSTWEQLRPYLSEGDEIRLLSGLDFGIAVIRGGHLHCLVITDHND